MKRLLATALALGLVAAAGAATAQSHRYDSQPGGHVNGSDRYGQGYGSSYDYARVLRVDPVFDSYSGRSRGGGYGSSGQRCYEQRTYAGRDGYYDGDGYRRDDGYYDPYGDRRNDTGATVATVIGGLVGAAVGSQVGGGSARYATSAIGTMVGGIAGRQVYEQSQRQRYGAGTVRVCDPVPSNGRYYDTGDRAVDAYDVTYEYAGRTYTTRTSYHPGDRIRVRVDVRPE